MDCFNIPFDYFIALHGDFFVVCALYRDFAGPHAYEGASFCQGTGTLQALVGYAEIAVPADCFSSQRGAYNGADNSLGYAGSRVYISGAYRSGHSRGA
jgi:hypothetical protein